MRVAVTGGKTGGHLYPSLAVIEALKEKAGVEFLYVGTRAGLEARIVPEMGLPFRTVWISGLYRRRFLKNLLFPLKMLVSTLQALFLLIRFKPQVILGTGGFVCWPVLSAGLLLRIPMVLQEQNQAPGLVTRLFAPFAKSVHLVSEGSMRHFKKKTNLRVTGNPTRKDLECRAPTHRFGLKEGGKVVFVFGGSQGAKPINDAIAGNLEQLMAVKNLRLLWAVGPVWLDSLKRLESGFDSRLRIVPYIEAIGEAYAMSDLVVCRAGATTVAEITRLGLPALFIPFAGAASGHQYENARALAEAGAGEVLDERDAQKEISAKILELLSDFGKLGEMSGAARRLGKPDAAVKIAEDLQSWVQPLQTKKHGRR